MAVTANDEIGLALNCAFEDAIVVGIVEHRIQDERWVHNGDFALS